MTVQRASDCIAVQNVQPLRVEVRGCTKYYNVCSTVAIVVVAVVADGKAISITYLFLHLFLPFFSLPPLLFLLTNGQRKWPLIRLA